MHQTLDEVLRLSRLYYGRDCYLIIKEGAIQIVRPADYRGNRTICHDVLLESQNPSHEHSLGSLLATLKEKS